MLWGVNVERHHSCIWRQKRDQTAVSSRWLKQILRSSYREGHTADTRRSQSAALVGLYQQYFPYLMVKHGSGHHFLCCDITSHSSETRATSHRPPRQTSTDGVLSLQIGCPARRNIMTCLQQDAVQQWQTPGTGSSYQSCCPCLPSSGHRSMMQGQCP